MLRNRHAAGRNDNGNGCGDIEGVVAVAAGTADVDGADGNDLILRSERAFRRFPFAPAQDCCDAEGTDESGPCSTHVV